MIKETLALFTGFALLAFGGGLLYRAFKRLTHRLFPNESPHEGADPAALVLTGFALTILFVLLMVLYTAVFLDRPLSTGSLTLALIVLMLLESALSFAGYRLARRMDQKRLSRRLMLQKQQAEVSYYKALEEQYTAQRVLIHDIRKHLASIRDLARSGDGAAVEEYIARLERSAALQNRVRICGNRLLDVILSRYAAICRDRGVGFTADVREGSVDMLAPEDMTALFCNLLENAVEASHGMAGGYLELSCTLRAGGAGMVTLLNTCQAPPKADGLGGFASTKPDPEGHGLGLKSIAAVTGKYGGALRQYYDPEEKLFHTVILLGPGEAGKS